MNMDQILHDLQAHKISPEEAVSLLAATHNGLNQLKVSVVLHPLLHKNTSQSPEYGFTSTFTGKELLLAHHVVNGSRVLPGVAYLEMARVAAEKFSRVQTENSSSEARTHARLITSLRGIVWLRPFVVSHEPASLHIHVRHEKAGEISYEVYSLVRTKNPQRNDPEKSASDNEARDHTVSKIIHSQGVAMRQEKVELLPLDLAALRSQCSGKALTGAECYQAFQAIKIDYGEAYRALKKVIGGKHADGKRFILADAVLPELVADSNNEYVLHPYVMDASLQALIGVLRKKAFERDAVSNGPAMKVALPFAMENLQIVRPCPSKTVTLIQEAEGSTERVPKFDLDICDEMGSICVRIRGYSTRVLEEGEQPQNEIELVRPTFHIRPASQRPNAAPWYTEHWVILCELRAPLEQAEMEKQYQLRSSEVANLPGIRWVTIATGKEDIVQRFTDCTERVLATVQQILRKKPRGKVLAQMLIPSQGKGWLLSGVAGLLKSANLENPQFVPQIIGIEAAETPMGLFDKIRENSNLPADRVIRYQNGERCVPVFGKIDAA